MSQSTNSHPESRRSFYSPCQCGKFSATISGASYEGNYHGREPGTKPSSKRIEGTGQTVCENCGRMEPEEQGDG